MTYGFTIKVNTNNNVSNQSIGRSPIRLFNVDCCAVLKIKYFKLNIVKQI